MALRDGERVIAASGDLGDSPTAKSYNQGLGTIFGVVMIVAGPLIGGVGVTKI